MNGARYVAVDGVNNLRRKKRQTVGARYKSSSGAVFRRKVRHIVSHTDSIQGDVPRASVVGGVRRNQRYFGSIRDVCYPPRIVFAD